MCCYSELHAGSPKTGNDNPWKIARVPCESGFLALYEPDSTARFRLLSRSGELSVRSVKLVQSEPGDEKHYNDETRAWVKRVQKRASVPESYYELAQKAVIPDKWSKSTVVPYTRSWMEPLMTIAAPQEGEVVDTIRARMSLNEWEPVQIGIYANDKELKGVTVTVDDIRAGDGSAVAQCDVRVAEYSLVRTRNESMPIKPFPQRLWPSYSFDVPQSRSHAVWIEVNTADVAGTKAGEYVTTVTINAANADPVTLPLKVEILPIKLLSMNEADLTLGNCTRGLIPYHEIALLGRYNHNCIIPWYFSARPELSGTGDEEISSLTGVISIFS